jgi:hypothetical protein
MAGIQVRLFHTAYSLFSTFYFALSTLPWIWRAASSSARFRKIASFVIGFLQREALLRLGAPTGPFKRVERGRVRVGSARIMMQGIASKTILIIVGQGILNKK